MDYTVFKAKILTKSPIKIANASLFEILCSAKDKSGCKNGSLYSIEMEQHLCSKILTSLVRDIGSSWNRAKFLVVGEYY